MEEKRDPMFKDFLLVRNPPDKSPEVTQRYLEFNHAPLALSVPIISQKMQLYTMNHVADGVAEACRLYPPISRIATVVEHGLGGWKSLEQIVADQTYSTTIRADEEYMVNNIMDGWPQFVAITDEERIFTSASHSDLRMLDFVRRPSCVTREAFLTELKDDGAWAIANRRYRSGCAKRVHSLASAASAAFGVEGEPFDAVIEVWIAEIAEMQSLMDEQRQRRSTFCDAARSCTVVTREHRIRG